MKTRGDDISEGDLDLGLLDELFEYILDFDDASVDDETKGGGWRMKKRTQRGRKQHSKKEANKEPGFLNQFIYNSDSDETPCDKRDDGSIKRTTGKKDKRRRNQLTEDAGVDNSMWDFFRPIPQESTTTTLKNPKKSASIPKTGKTAAKTQDTTAKKSTSKVIEKEAIKTDDKAAKKGGLFRRLRRKEKDDETIKSEKSAKDLPIREKTVVPRTGDQSSTIKKKKKVIDTNDKEDSLDPFQFFVDMIEALDPFASDDSDADSSGTDQVSATAENGIASRDDVASGHAEHGIATRDDIVSTEKSGISTKKVSAIDQLVDDARTDSKIVEIRLNFKSLPEPDLGGVDESSQFDDPEPDQDVNGYRLEDNSIIESVTPRQFRNEDESGMDFKCRSVPPLAEEQQVEPAAPLFYVPEASHDSKFEENEKSLKISRRRGLASLVCCMVKKKPKKVVTHDVLAASVPIHSIPATNVVPDDEMSNPKVSETCATEVQSVTTGAPSTLVSEPQGPQSNYGYDQDAQENIDVFYDAMGLDPKTSMLVRELGRPPTISPSDLHEEVVVQIQVRTENSADWSNEGIK
jgi:hypothetical protein